MSDYMVESGASARVRARRRRALVTLLIVVLALFGAFWFAWSYWKQPPTPAAASSPTCTTVKVVAKPVRVNVYNATGRDGLAASTAAALKQRGFVIGTVANDPLKKKITATAEVRYGKAGAATALSVLALVNKPAKLADRRKDATVDLVLGNAFKALVPAPTATSTLPACKPTSTGRTTPAKKATTPGKKPTKKPTTTK